MNCPHMESCELYGHFASNAMLAIWKTRYCEAEADRFERCERHRLSSLAKPVPPTLLPNGEHIELPGGKPGDDSQCG
jgi:hypothetical protein